MSFFERIKEMFFPSGAEGSSRKSGSRLLLLLVVGVGLLLFNSIFSFGGDRSSPAPPDHETIYLEEGGREEERFVLELTAMLNQIQGVDNVMLILTTESSGRLELVTDREETKRSTVEDDAGGGTREITEETLRWSHVILRDAQGRETPVVIQENLPRYRGVLVVACGVENPAVKAQVVEALRAVLDLPEHRITVLPRGG